MALSVSSLVAAATVLAPAVRAYGGSDGIDIADTVDAGEATPVEVDIDSDDDYYSDYQGLRIYLATTPPGWGTGPACWLVNYTDINTNGAEVDVTIPAAVAPDGTDLSLSYSMIDFEGYSSESFSYSNDFTLSGGTGEWSAMELNGYGISNPDYCPCTALQCSRQCSDKYFPTGDLEDEDDDAFEATYKEWYTCVSACPGTSYPAYDFDGSDGGDGDDDSATSTGLQTSTQTASPVHSSKTATSTSASATATGSSESTGSATSSASATGTTTTTTATAASGASRTALTTTALLVWCFGMALWL